MSKNTFNKECYKQPNEKYDKNFLAYAFLRRLLFGKNLLKGERDSAMLSVKKSVKLLGAN